MSNSNELQNVVTRILWQGDGRGRGSIYAVLDAARDPAIYPRLAESDIPKVCLFIGDQARELAMFAPYLVELDKNDSFTQWIIEKGWGKSWGVFIETKAGFIKLRNHLRSFLRVADEEGKILIFRYYDPRVLRIFLPACDPVQLKTMFGVIDRYYLEGRYGNSIIRCSLDESKISLVKDITKLKGNGVSGI